MKTRSHWLMAFVGIFFDFSNEKQRRKEENHQKKTTSFDLQLIFHKFAKKSVGLLRKPTQFRFELVQHIFSLLTGYLVECRAMPNSRRYRGGTPPRSTSTSQAR